jgi:hypothetical protein
VQVSARANQGAICPDRAPRDARDVAGACRAMAQKSGSGIPDLVAEIILRRASAKPLSLFVADVVVGHWLREKVADLTALTFSDFNSQSPAALQTLGAYGEPWPSLGLHAALIIRPQPRSMSNARSASAS